MKKQKIMPLDGSKPLVELLIDQKHHIKVGCNFHPQNVKKMIDELRKLKEVLVVEFSKKNEKGHHSVWGLQATEEEIEEHSRKVMKKPRSAKEQAADKKRRESIKRKSQMKNKDLSKAATQRKEEKKQAARDKRKSDNKAKKAENPTNTKKLSQNRAKSKKGKGKARAAEL